MKLLAASVSLFVLMALDRGAQAQPAAQPADQPSLASHTTTRDPFAAITVSPLHFLVPMAELTAEVRVAPRIGLAVIGGLGQLRIATTNERVNLFEAGASARYYVIGSFRTGVQLGGEALYVHASTQDMSIDVKARGLGLSAFVGYKWTHGSGFTLEGQLGATYITARAAAASTTTTATAEASHVGPMLNLNVGWSL